MKSSRNSLRLSFIAFRVSFRFLRDGGSFLGIRSVFRVKGVVSLSSG